MNHMNLDDIPDEICAWCGKGFEARRITQKYCCEACQRKSRSAFTTAVVSEEKRRARAGKTCKQCGATFDPKKSDAIYCGKRCQHRAEYERRKERRRALRSAGF